jgi:hypothetical protein
MCKELPVILVNKVVDPKRIIGQKMEGRGGGEAQGVADQKKNEIFLSLLGTRLEKRSSLIQTLA